MNLSLIATVAVSDAARTAPFGWSASHAVSLARGRAEPTAGSCSEGEVHAELQDLGCQPVAGCGCGVCGARAPYRELSDVRLADKRTAAFRSTVQHPARVDLRALERRPRFAKLPRAHGRSSLCAQQSRLVSAPSKRSFSSASSPILACSDGAAGPTP